LLEVTPATVLRWTRQGSLPAVRLPGGQIRYRADELDRWLMERATPRGELRAATDGAAPARVLSAVRAAHN
jgi:excisionase family DNA binding protein